MRRDDFSPPRPGDRFTARAALREGERIAADEERESGREDHCHGYANCCRCKVCSLSPAQRRLRRRLHALPSTSTPTKEQKAA